MAHDGSTSGIVGPEAIKSDSCDQPASQTSASYPADEPIKQVLDPHYVTEEARNEST